MTTALVMMVRRVGPSDRMKFVEADLLEPDGTCVYHVPSAVFVGFEPVPGQLVEYVGDSPVHPSAMTQEEWLDTCSPVVREMYPGGGSV